ncbi:MAG TPA: type 4a pilus biogenesis protein PilO [Candidatus Polarisedimenticolia bacterium]|nr:type 4a pilus biogenesis protein PilO [Candidatus Polarisedimenticolia bacterium]
MKRRWTHFDVREKSPFIAALILAWLGLNLAFAFVVNVPRASEAVSLAERRDELDVQLAARERDMTKLRDHHGRVQKGSEELQRFYESVLSSKAERMISFQKEIRDIAKQFRIDLKSIAYSTEPAPTKDKIARFSAQMPLTGSYESLREFIETIEKSHQFIIINSIALSNSKEGGVILGLGIQLSTYFLDPEMPDKDEAAAGAGRRG